MKTKYFAGVKTLQELRKTYKKLAFENHPDKGGDVEIMKAINNEYERLSKILINSNEDFTAEQKEAEAAYSEAIIEKLNVLFKFEGLIIEIVGYWIWLTGATYTHRAEIKEAGFKFAKAKAAWFWHDGEFRKKSKKRYDLETIREMYGSEEVKNTNPRKFTIAS